MWIAVLLVTLTALTRLVPHIPNFAPLVAIALFSGTYLKGKWAFLLPLSLYVATDLIIGLHNTVFFTWGSLLLIFMLGRGLAKRKTPVTVISFTLISSFLFFIVSNFGVWLMGWYSRTGEGLIACFTLAIPFFRTSLTSDLLFAGALFTVYEFALRRHSLRLLQPLS